MQLPLLDALGFGAAGALANVERTLAERRLDDEAVAGLVAALAARDAAGAVRPVARNPGVAAARRNLRAVA